MQYESKKVIGNSWLAEANAEKHTLKNKSSGYFSFGIGNVGTQAGYCTAYTTAEAKRMLTFIRDEADKMLKKI